MRRTLGVILAAAIALAVVCGAVAVFWNPQSTKPAFDPVVPGNFAGRTMPLAERQRSSRAAGNDEVKATRATKWHDGQITKSLSSPSRKNIPLATSGKSDV